MIVTITYRAGISETIAEAALVVPLPADTATQIDMPTPTDTITTTVVEVVADMVAALLQVDMVVEGLQGAKTPMHNRTAVIAITTLTR